MKYIWSCNRILSVNGHALDDILDSEDMCVIDALCHSLDLIDAVMIKILKNHGQIPQNDIVLSLLVEQKAAAQKEIEQDLIHFLPSKYLA